MSKCSQPKRSKPNRPLSLSIKRDSFNEREAEQLSAQLTEFAAQNKAPLYIAAYSAVSGETIEERANRLKAEWLDGGPGIVIAYERGTERLSFAADADDQNFLARFDLQNLFEAGYTAAARFDRGSSRLIAAAEVVMRELPPALEYQRLSVGESNTATRQFVGWSLAALGLVAAIGMLAFSFLRRVQSREDKSYEFPLIKVAERYGAPYSGGHQAEIQF